MSTSKKLISIALITFLVIFGFVSCSPKQAETTSAQTVEKSAAVAAPAPAPAPAPVKVDVVKEAAEAYFAAESLSYIIPTETVVKAIADNEDVFILDIRRAEDYAKGHLVGAVNAPWGPSIAENMVNLPDDKPIYLYCYTGQTAGQTVALLQVAGFDAKSIKYGWNLGISKTEGIDAYTETVMNSFGAPSGVKIDADIADAITQYFATLNADEKAKSNIIAAAAAKDYIDENEGNVTVVSIRQAADYAKGHIAGAINIPYVSGMQTQFEKLPKDQKVLVYCYSGQTAGQTVAILRLLGYDAASIKSGIGTPVTAPSGWGNEGFPLVQ